MPQSRRLPRTAFGGIKNVRILADSFDASKPAGSLELRSGALIEHMPPYHCPLYLGNDRSEEEAVAYRLDTGHSLIGSPIT